MEDFILVQPVAERLHRPCRAAVDDLKHALVVGKAGVAWLYQPACPGAYGLSVRAWEERLAALSVGEERWRKLASAAIFLRDRKSPTVGFSLPIRIDAQKPSAKLEFVTSPTWAGSSSLVEYHNAVVIFDPALAQSWGGRSKVVSDARGAVVSG